MTISAPSTPEPSAHVHDTMGVNDTLSSFELRDGPDATFVERIVDRTIAGAGAAIIIAITALVFGNATSRYIFNFTAIWADELIVALMPWLAMCGVYLSIRQREMIRIDYFVEKFPPKIKRVITMLSQVFSAAVFAYLGFGGFQYLNLFGGDLTLYLELPTGWFTSALLIGSALVAIAFLIEAVRDFQKDSTPK
ncbi:hypothetical protein IZ6_13810 [Terrihabitans soli]|uniref:TRAP transporter small permease protein n=1 Tax=Terrihabitans soli TaxID=708113 RepID=A0A6S6QMN8_9HYPH|nr:TRAP transporter small permease [Terrihabitans soli]BCJ90646.1 hypothetical protein IZ6_13810 [Terrihabitans soli]